MKTKSLLRDLNSAIGEIKYIALNQYNLMEVMCTYIMYHPDPCIHLKSVCITTGLFSLEHRYQFIGELS